MDKIVEFINEQTNNKYQNLLFFGGVYNKDNNSLCLNFSQRDKSWGDDCEAQLADICRQYFGELVKDIKISFRSSSLTLPDLKQFVLDKVNHKKELSCIDADKITFSFDDETCVNIPYNFGALNQGDLSRICEELENEIMQELNYKIVVKFLENKSSFSIVDARKEKLEEDNLIFEQIKQSQIVDISDIENIHGEITSNRAYIAGSLPVGASNECVVGNVSKCFLRETKPKILDEQNSDAKREFEPKKFLSFDLEFDGMTTKAIWFLPKELQNAEPIKDGDTIVVLGSANTYRDMSSFKVTSIAKCKFIPPKKVWRKCPKQYCYIKPEPYEFLQQSSLFFSEEKTKNKYLLENTFVVYDLETTGINAENCKIIDIGAYKIVEGKIVEKFCTFVNPQCEIPEEASKINRITNSLVEDAPTIEMALPDFYKFCYGSIIVGYNNIGFDDLFVAKEGKRQFYNFDNKREDCFNIAKKHLPGLRNYKLSTVCQVEDVPLIDAHRASNDALATAKLFIKLVEKFC